MENLRLLGISLILQKTFHSAYFSDYKENKDTIMIKLLSLIKIEGVGKIASEGM